MACGPLEDPARPMKRFYKQATVSPEEGGVAVLLDGRPVRTPGRNLLRVPTEELAEAIAGEWNGQGEQIDARAMPLTGLANRRSTGSRPIRSPSAARWPNMARATSSATGRRARKPWSSARAASGTLCSAGLERASASRSRPRPESSIAGSPFARSSSSAGPWRHAALSSSPGWRLWSPLPAR